MSCLVNRPILFIVAFTAILNLFYGTGEPLVAFGPVTITMNGILNSVMIAVRIIVLMFFTSPHDAADDAPAGPTPAGGAVTSDDVADGGTQAAATGAAVATSAPERATTTVAAGEGLTVVAVAVCAVLTVLLGVAPSPVLDAIASVAVLLP